MVRFFNTLSGKIEEFKPLHNQEVRMYTCGPTVYDYAHIGNFRTFVFEDLLRRFLEFKGFRVKHVMNITDVDDKTIAGAAREGKKLDDFTETYTQAFHEDLRTLNILEPNYPKEQPRATHEIHAMIELIRKLVKKGVAYVSDGSVYYRIASFPNYGKLSKKKLEGNITGARVDVDEYDKEEGADFALWKKSQEGVASWDSPWGKGRPGWHIECSAMSMKYLGETFDIHAGGEDLVFPHHENEIAQSEAATGKPFVRYWLHSKHLLVNGEKMSKSKGNYYTLRDLLAKGYDPMAIRYALLATHYRVSLNFTLQGLDESADIIKRLDQCYYQCLSVTALDEKQETDLASETSFNKQSSLKDSLIKILGALGDDLNISIALAILIEKIREINSWFAYRAAINVCDLKGALYFFQKVDELLGLDVAEQRFIPLEKVEMLRQIIDSRKSKDFTRSDALRRKMEESNWFVKDSRPGEPSTIRPKRRAWDLLQK